MDQQRSGELVVVTGMTGAGRSTAAKELEDLGFFVVDNLPPQMLVPLLDVAEHAGESLPRIAVVVDVRPPRSRPRREPFEVRARDAHPDRPRRSHV